jgi:PAS domain S-box-containing protein
LWTEDAEPDFHLAFVEDIADRKQTEERLREEQQLLSQSQRIACIGSWSDDFATRRLTFTDEAYRRYGVSRESFVPSAEAVIGLVHPDDRDAWREQMQAIAAGENASPLEFRVPLPDGQVRTLSGQGELIRDEAGRPVRLIGTVQDITERKRNEQSLIESEEKYRGLITEMNDGIFVTDTRGSIMFANPALAHVLGFEHPDSVIGKSIFEFIVPTMANQVAGYLRQIVESGIARQSTVVEIIRQDGSNAFVEVRSKAMMAGNQVTGTKGVIRDITESKRNEQELRRSEERFAKLFYASPFGMLVASYPDGKIIDVNEAYLRISGFERADVIGKTTNELNVWEHPTDRLALLERLRESGSARNMEIAFRTKSAERRTLLISVEIIQLQGQPHSLAMSIDVSEQKLATEQMRLLRDELAHVARVGTMGELASGLAHELNQPLAAVHLYAGAAQQLGAGCDSAALQKCLRRIGEQSLRAGEIVRRMRDFVRRDPSRREPADLNQLLRDVLLLLENDLRQCGVALELGLDQTLFPVLVDGIQIQQVLVNLIRNAIDAMNRPEVSVRRLSIRTSATPDGVRVSVADTGGGIDPGIADKLFHPFHSTKSSGLGLGLAICRTLIEAHGGCIGAVPAPDGGTSFFFLIPAAEARIPR